MAAMLVAPGEILTTVMISAVAFVAAYVLIGRVQHYNLRASLFGLDLNKKGTARENTKIPEAMGIWPAFVFLIAISICQLVHSQTPAHRAEYNSALHTICFMVLLGFADDVLELPWRMKLIFPGLASIPMLVGYAGGTTIIIPKPLQYYVGDSVDLHVFYLVYMCLLAIFTTNAINIFAGINGLEAGQSVVIAVAVLIHNYVELHGPQAAPHFFSMTLMMPFAFTTAALLLYNWYPSAVFVGDTFTTYAGMTFAVAGIMGHFSKTLLLFFMPQVLNFVYSLPQLLKIVPCPRHRLPRYNAATGKLEGIWTNMNLVNLALLILGPQTERRLCVILLAFQAACCAIGFFVRYHVSTYFY
ncbi:UDP-N-acetylglucosamine--dolichyl-phosphate N-acetylglucosaminephosphotransferase [Plasmodiophora brassicae]|uniref:UDP-N-acetylglucosamine--dolichyl-phosphate N-acetylglucosaminephosphotransferase n=1 Tax=Plasmodiophora brassicae TaxID=37360 RepID=A0A0G4IUD8_PLABS|nr:hypothetical protein PBRA_006820 [Plasmodiophora brassicae]SPR00844.1 unnamed protein product [Plasmodiophora brassicae]